MTPSEVLDTLRTSGLVLRCRETSEGLTILVDGSAKRPRVTPDDAALIREHRAGLLALLLDELRTRTAKYDVSHNDDWTPWIRNEAGHRSN